MAHEEPAVPEISREELVEQRRRGEPFVLVDVLTPDSFQHLHLPGAINVPLPVLRDLAPVLFGRHDEIIVYCSNPECTASVTAVKILLQLGFTHVREYPGGLQDWINAHLPVVHTPHEEQNDAAA